MTRQNVPPKLLSPDKKAMAGDFKRHAEFSIDGEHLAAILHRSVFRHNGGRIRFYSLVTGPDLGGF